MKTRRELLQWASAMALLPTIGLANTAIRRANKPLAILILGGTGFLGVHQVEHALTRGHRITLFNRGRSAPGLFGDRVEMLIGNRDAKIDAGLLSLAGERRWDVVIDNSGYLPRHVQNAVDLLKNRVHRYIYVSSVAVYDATTASTFDERAVLRPGPSPITEQVTAQSYGPLKADCDRIVQAALGDRATIVRPTYVVGPDDDTDRFTYWIERMARGGEVLAPPDLTTELQWIDVRDLCPWIIQLAEEDRSGIYNAAGPSTRVSWRRVLQQLSTIMSSHAKLTPATPAVLQETKIRLPLVREGFMGGSGSLHFDSRAALAAGLKFRPLADTVAATRAWWRSQSEERRSRADGWPSAEQERAALQRLIAS